MNAVLTIPQQKVACDVSDRNGVLVAVQSPKWVGLGQARERRKHKASGRGDCWPRHSGKKHGAWLQTHREAILLGTWAV